MPPETVNYAEDPQLGDLFEDDQGDLRFVTTEGNTAVKFGDEADADGDWEVLTYDEEPLLAGHVDSNGDWYPNRENFEEEFVAFNAREDEEEDDTDTEEDETEDELDHPEPPAEGDFGSDLDLDALIDRTVVKVHQAGTQLLNRANIEDRPMINRSLRRLAALGVASASGTSVPEKEYAMAIDTLNDIALKYDIAVRAEVDAILTTAMNVFVDAALTKVLGPVPS